MRKSAFFLNIIFLFILISCVDKNKETNAKISSNKILVRYFPADIETIKKDTLSEDGNFEISVASNDLNTYVINKYKINDTTYIDKYRDSKVRLVINQNSNKLIDTVFYKENFKENLDKTFIKTAIFSYRFQKAENDNLVFFGKINVPETCNSFSFYHFFDIKTRSFKIEEYIEEDE